MRILQITAHATRGLSAAPAFVLNTASTHALSLAALWVPADRAYLRCLHARSRMYEEVVRSYAPPGAAAATATKGSGKGYGPADTTVDDALVSALDAYLAGTLTSSSQKGDEGGGGGDEEEEGDDGRSVLSKGTATRSRRRSAAFARYLQYPSLSDASPRLRSLTTPPPPHHHPTHPPPPPTPPHRAHHFHHAGWSGRRRVNPASRSRDVMYVGRIALAASMEGATDATK